jgi:hypothetical protein
MPRSRTNSRFTTYSGVGVNPQIAESSAVNKITPQDKNNWDNRIELRWTGRCVGGGYVSHILVQYAGFLPNGSADFTALTPEERQRAIQGRKSSVSLLLLPGATQLHSLNRTRERAVLGGVLIAGAVCAGGIAIASIWPNQAGENAKRTSRDYEERIQNTFNLVDRERYRIAADSLQRRANDLQDLSIGMCKTAAWMGAGVFAVNLISGIAIRYQGSSTVGNEGRVAKVLPYYDIYSQSSGVKLNLNF